MKFLLQEESSFRTADPLSLLLNSALYGHAGLPSVVFSPSLLSGSLRLRTEGVDCGGSELDLQGEVNLDCKSQCCMFCLEKFCLQLWSCESAICTWERWEKTVFSCIFCAKGKFLLAEKEVGKPRNGQLALLGRGQRLPTCHGLWDTGRHTQQLFHFAVGGMCVCIVNCP